MPQNVLRLVASQPNPQTTEFALVVNEWIIILEADDYSELTLAHYNWHLQQLTAWLVARHCTRLNQVTEHLLRQWAVSIKTDQGWSSNTRRQAMIIAQAFFRWCHREGLILEIPTERLKAPRPKEKPLRTVSAGEVEQMLMMCGGRDDEIGKRNAAIIALLYDSGLRSKELCQLLLKDLDLETRQLFVRIKGGAVMPGWFGERCVIYLKDWLDVRWAKPNVETLFVGVGGRTPGQPITPRGLRVIIRDAGNRAGISDCSPHAFRRGFAVALSAIGIADNVLKDLGRWKDITMVRRYTLAQRVAPLYRSPLDNNTSTRI